MDQILEWVDLKKKLNLTKLGGATMGVTSPIGLTKFLLGLVLCG